MEGVSRARIGKTGGLKGGRVELLAETPNKVPIEISQAPDGIRFEGGHDGYVSTHGLTHARRLELTFDGRAMVGEDLLMALDDPAKKTFDDAMDAVKLAGLRFQLRFHLHPEVDASIDLGGAAISMALKSGEIWVFRHDGALPMALEASVYLDKGRLRPRATKQIVLTGRAMEYATRIRWSLAKAQDTAIAIRDLNRDDWT